jgi:hypothetical protein
MSMAIFIYPLFACLENSVTLSRRTSYLQLAEQIIFASAIVARSWEQHGAFEHRP